MPIFRAVSFGSVHAWRDVVSSALKSAGRVRASLATPLRAIALAIAVAIAGCLAPTLPIPPPSAPEVSAPDANGEVTVRGEKGAAKAGAILHVINETGKESDPACQPNAVDAGPCVFGVDTQVLDDGSYWTTIRAKHGDSIYVTQTVGTESSGGSQSTQVP
jgi:hypothetical protein